MERPHVWDSLNANARCKLLLSSPDPIDEGVSSAKQSYSGHVICSICDSVDATSLRCRDLEYYRAVSITSVSPTTHNVAIVSGLEDASIRDALATYLLNCAVQSVRVNLAILNDLLGDSEDAATALAGELTRLLGNNNDLTDDFRQDQRDPWMAEALAHLLLKIAGNLPPLPPPGSLHALTPVHDDVKEHGLDLVGIYTNSASGNLGLAVSETKASANNPTAHVASAADLFTSVMTGRRDPHIRSKIQSLRHALPSQTQTLITPSFWKNECCFSAYVAMSDSCDFDANAARPTYLQIQPRATIVIVPLSNYQAFFDSIADRMRSLISTDGGVNV